MARYVDPTFEIGMALGNAYGNMWTANAKKRQEEKAERLISDMMGGNVTSEDVNAAITSGTGVLGQQNQVTAQDVQAAIRGWPAGLTTEAMRNNLRKNKINQEVVDKVMPRYEKQMRDDMTAKFLPQIMGSLYGDNPDYGDAMVGALELSKYNPDVAKVLLGSIPTGKDVLDYNRAVTVKGMGLGSLNGAGGVNRPNASWYGAIASEIKNYEDEKALYGNLSPEKEARLAGLYVVRDSIIPPVYGASTGSSAEGAEKGVWDKVTDYVSDIFGSDKPVVSESYGKSMNEWQSALARNQKAGEDVRWSKQQMIDYAKKKYGADADAIIGATDWKAFGF